MTQEEKQLLLKDISARLLYKVKCRITKKGVVRELKPMDNGINIPVNQVCDITLTKILNTDIVNDFVNDNIALKPYLRPMSSMTEEEKEEMTKMSTLINSVTLVKELGDWLNAHYLDYRGLIPMGLALEAPEDMYKTD